MILFLILMVYLNMEGGGMNMGSDRDLYVRPLHEFGSFSGSMVEAACSVKSLFSMWMLHKWAD